MSNNGNGRFSHPAYAVVRGTVQIFFLKYRSIIPPHLEFEDFLQEAAMTFLTNTSRPAWFVCIDYLRQHIPLTRRDIENGKKCPLFIDIDSIPKGMI